MKRKKVEHADAEKLLRVAGELYADEILQGMGLPKVDVNFRKKSLQDQLSLVPEHILEKARRQIEKESLREQKSDGQDKTINCNQKIILQVLASKNLTMKQVEIEDALQENRTPLSRKTIGKHLARLRELGLVHRPDGEHGGEAITKNGRKLITKT